MLAVFLLSVKIMYGVVFEKPYVWGLFKNVQMRDAQKTEPRGVYRYTLSGAVCSVTQQMSVFQQPRNLQFYSFHKRVELQAMATTGTRLNRIPSVNRGSVEALCFFYL